MGRFCARTHHDDNILGIRRTDAGEAARGYGDTAEQFDDIDQIVEWAREVAAPGTTLLVKGSRSARMERVVRALTGQAAGEGAH